MVVGEKEERPGRAGRMKLSGWMGEWMSLDG